MRLLNYFNWFGQTIESSKWNKQAKSADWCIHRHLVTSWSSCSIPERSSKNFPCVAIFVSIDGKFLPSQHFQQDELIEWLMSITWKMKTEEHIEPASTIRSSEKIESEFIDTEPFIFNWFYIGIFCDFFFISSPIRLNVTTWHRLYLPKESSDYSRSDTQVNSYFSIYLAPFHWVLHATWQIKRK